MWHFDSGDVELTETPDPGFLNGPWQLIDPEVVVRSPNSGDWHYDGVFNENTLRTNFIVTGELCSPEHG